MERLNWIILESSADLRQNLQSSASDNKPGVIQHLLAWLRALARRHLATVGIGQSLQASSKSKNPLYVQQTPSTIAYPPFF
jgi:hypothetical protein